MIPARDIWRAANLVIREHSAEAEIVAARRADEMLERGDRRRTARLCAPAANRLLYNPPPLLATREREHEAYRADRSTRRSRPPGRMRPCSPPWRKSCGTGADCWPSLRWSWDLSSWRWPSWVWSES